MTLPIFSLAYLMTLILYTVNVLKLSTTRRKGHQSRPASNAAGHPHQSYEPPWAGRARPDLAALGELNFECQGRMLQRMLARRRWR